MRRGELKMLPTAEVGALAKAAGALSDPVRLQMLHLLSQREDLCTCEFEELLGLSQSKVSYHLNVLLQAGFVLRESRGAWSHYRLRHPEVLNQLWALVIEHEQLEAMRP
jgi:ArsR family transcriptional regulator